MESKKVAFAAFASLVLLLPAVALAQEEATAGDVGPIMASGIGAQVRMLELEKNVARNVILGQAVIDYLKANKTNASTTELQSILDQLSAVKAEAAAVNFTAMNRTELVRLFVDLKKDSINLTRQFRDAASKVVSRTAVSEIRAGVADDIAASNQQYRERLRELVRQFNSGRVGSILDAINVSRPDLVEGVANGSMNVGQAMKEVRDILKAMEPQQRRQAVLAMLGEMNGVSAMAAEALLRTNERALERMQERLSNRLGHGGGQT